jgi:Tol biopolymer transport system component
MKPFMFILLLVACVLAACGQNTRAPTPLEEIPLLTDADFDKAQLQIADDVKELVGMEEGMALAGQELSPLADIKSELSSQAVLPNASGIVFYAQQDQRPIIGVKPYSIYRHDQRFDERAIIYSGFRKIQSVAGSMDGDPITSRGSVVVSMREKPEPNGPLPGNDLEIFLITFDEFGHPTIFQLTSDSVDNTNVSVTGDRNRIVYNQPVSGKDTVVLRTRQGFASYNSVILSATYPQRHASISINGQYIALVRNPVGGNDSIQRYTVATNSYLGVGSTGTGNTFEFPSVSADGQQVLLLRNSTTRPQIVILKNLSTGTTQTVASGTAIRHPFLSTDGRFMTYQEGRNIMTKDLITGQVQALTNSLTSLITYYSPMWQMFYQPPAQVGQLRVNIRGLPSGQKRVRVTGPNSFNSGLFGSSRTFSNLTLGTYTVSAQGFVLGVLGKPTCRIYSAEPAQSVTVVANHTATVNVAYQVEPCPPDLSHLHPSGLDSLW